MSMKANIIRTLIVDDEPLARRGILYQLKREPDIEVIGECSNGGDALASIEGLSPDLVFLDIQMPDINGFEVISAIEPDHLPAIIFVTAYDQYALRAFEVHALDYLLKPFDRERFLHALNHAKASIERRAIVEIKEQLSGLLRSYRSEQHYLEKLVIKSGGRIFFINVNEVDWMQSANNYVCLHTHSGDYLVRDTITNIEGKIDPARFLRIRHSTIVNISRIKELHPLFQGEYSIFLHNGETLTSSRRYRHKIKNFIES